MVNRKIKICHIANSDSVVKFLLLPQLKFLEQEGYDVFVVCTCGKWIDEIKKEGIKIKDIKIKRRITPFYDLITLFKLYVYLKKEKFDIVHTHNPKPGLLGQAAAKTAGVPIIINTIHGLYFDQNSSIFKRDFFIFIEKIAAECSDLIFSQNKEDISTLIKEKITGREKIKYLGNGVDLKKFDLQRFSEEFIARKKKELGLNPDFRIIGAVGRLVAEKGYLDLFEALKIVLQKFPKILLLVVGPEDSEKKDAINIDIIKDYGIEKNIVFLGERTDLDELYSLMDIFVFPSHREGFPRSLIEAMAMQSPIIVTDIRGCREAIDNGRTGILAPMKNPEKLADAIVFLLESPEKAKEMGKSARKKAEKEFDENLVFDRIKKEYDRLLKEKNGKQSYFEKNF